jgi:hypothetical protein
MGAFLLRGDVISGAGKHVLNRAQDGGGVINHKNTWRRHGGDGLFTRTGLPA